MAAAKPQGKLIIGYSISFKLTFNVHSLDSPCSVPRPSQISHRDTEKDGTVFSSRGPIEVYTIHDSDSESDPDIQSLTTAMGSVTILAAEKA